MNWSQNINLLLFREQQNMIISKKIDHFDSVEDGN